MRPGLIVILALEFVIDAFNTLGWWFTLPVAERVGTYRRLFWVRCAGSALNESIPAASVGGEPAKVLLLRERISTSAATASLLATKVSFSFSTAIFIIVGLAAVWSRLNLPLDISLPLLMGFILMLIGITTFAILQLRGIGAGMVRVLRRLRIPVRWLALIESSSHEVDVHLDEFYRARTGNLIRAMGAHLCAFGCGAVQILLMLGWIGFGFDSIAALGIEAFSMLIAFVGFARHPGRGESLGFLGAQSASFRRDGGRDSIPPYMVVQDNRGSCGFRRVAAPVTGSAGANRRLRITSMPYALRYCETWDRGQGSLTQLPLLGYRFTELPAGKTHPHLTSFMALPVRGLSSAVKRNSPYISFKPHLTNYMPNMVNDGQMNSLCA